MSKVALLSCDSLEGFVCYDDLLIVPFAKEAYEVDIVSWKSAVNWNEYESVIVRSTWDYQKDLDSFVSVLEQIENSSAQLQNSLELMKWNFDKNYLKDLKEQGALIIPSEFAEDYEHETALRVFEEFDCPEIIIKPCVSANSDDTFRLNRGELESKRQYFAKLFRGRSHLYQPFVKSVVERGGYSLFYFGGLFSHAILKTPKTGDFRVQEEHGGHLTKIEAPSSMTGIGSSIISSLPKEPLYARVDLVSFENSWALMELELIEPSLYFNLDSGSPAKFVEAYKRTL